MDRNLRLPSKSSVWSFATIPLYEISFCQRSNDYATENEQLRKRVNDLTHQVQSLEKVQRFIGTQHVNVGGYSQMTLQ